MRKRSTIDWNDATRKLHEHRSSTIARLTFINNAAQRFHGYFEPFQYRSDCIYVGHLEFSAFRYGFAAKKILMYILSGEINVTLTSEDIKIALECVEQNEWHHVKFKKIK